MLTKTHRRKTIEISFSKKLFAKNEINVVVYSPEDRSSDVRWLLALGYKV